MADEKRDEQEDLAPLRDDAAPPIESKENEDQPPESDVKDAPLDAPNAPLHVPNAPEDADIRDRKERKKRSKDKHEDKSRSRSRERRKDQRRESSRSRSRDRRRNKHSSRSRSPSKDRKPKESSKARQRSSSREPDRRRRSISREPDRKKRSISRSPSREVYRRRSPSRDRRRDRSRSRDRNRNRSRSRDRGYRGRGRFTDYSRSRSRSRNRRGYRYRSMSPGGYVPRAPNRSHTIPQAQSKPLFNEFGVIGVSNQAASAPKITSDPRAAAALVAAAALPPSSALLNPPIQGLIPAATTYPIDTESMQKLIAEQQLRSQQIALQQQLTAMTAANNAKILKEQRAARRIYVGNLVPGMVTEDHLKAIFNSALQAAFPGSGLPGMEPVVAMTKPTDGRFYFVEMRTPEMASAAMQLHQQVTLHGRVMNVQRPVDYVAAPM